MLGAKETFKRGDGRKKMWIIKKNYQQMQKAKADTRQTTQNSKYTYINKQYGKCLKNYF